MRSCKTALNVVFPRALFVGMALAATLAVSAVPDAEPDSAGPAGADAIDHRHHGPHTGHGDVPVHNHAEHRPDAGDDDPHRHHKVATGLTRSVASYRIPDVAMVDQTGARVSVPELLSADGPVLVNFIFTTCTAICPVMSATFAQVQEKLGNDSAKVTMVSVSIDPEQDTPEALAAYAERFHAGPQWRFLTGSLEDSIAVQEAFDAYRGDKMNHAPLTLLRSGPDAQWVRYDGFAGAADLAKESLAMLAN